MTPWELAKSGTEHAEQKAFFAWCNCAERYGFDVADDARGYSHKDRETLFAAMQGVKWEPSAPVPELRWIHAIHNQGHGDKIRGGRAKAEGVKPGVWDIFFPRPRWSMYHGLYIEMKRATRVNQDALSLDQKEFQVYCVRYNYRTVVCFSWQEAAQAVKDYLA